MSITVLFNFCLNQSKFDEDKILTKSIWYSHHFYLWFSQLEKLTTEGIITLTLAKQITRCECTQGTKRHNSPHEISNCCEGLWKCSALA